MVGCGHFYAAVRRTEEATGPKVWQWRDVRIKGLEKGKDWRIGLNNSARQQAAYQFIFQTGLDLFVWLLT